MVSITYNNYEPKRLDMFLQQTYPVLSTGKLNKYLRENKIKLNGKKMPLSTRVKKGDAIKLFINDDLLVQQEYQYDFLYAKDILTVVFEDDDLLIADKPSGIIVVDPSEKEKDTLIHRALKYLYNKGEYDPESEFTPCLCHRLDTGTSGLTIIAKTVQAQEFIKGLFGTNNFKKEYLCVTFNIPDPKKATLRGFHVKNAELGIVKIVDTAPKNSEKPVETRYEVIATSGVLALCKVRLITGRTHQIRAHFESINCPVLGDSKYGNNQANRQRKLRYQALSAWQISFPNIKDDVFDKYSKMVITAEKPWYYQQILDGILY